jgi:hypothetical protein
MRYDIRAKIRTYKDSSGEEKAVYANIGSAWIGEKTNSILLDTIPVNWDGRAFINEPYEKKEGSKDVAIEDIDDKPIDLSKIPF